MRKMAAADPSGQTIPGKPFAYPGTYPSFDALMAAMPTESRPLVNEWRRAEYIQMARGDGGTIRSTCPVT